MKPLTKKQQYWLEIIDDWSRSGVTQAAYCRRHHLDVMQFYQWKKTLGAMKKENATIAGQFLPVPVMSTPSSHPVLVSVGGVEVHYTHDTDDQLFLRLLQLVEHRA